jgi:hypothetical protein
MITHTTQNVTLSSEWVKSSLSFANGNCVEARVLEGDAVQVRHSKKPWRGAFTFTPDEWEAFIGGVLLGEFRLPQTPSDAGG